MTTTRDKVPVLSALDTNRCSCSDETDAERVFAYWSGVTVPATVRAGGLAPHRLPGSPSWRPVGAVGSRSTEIDIRCPRPVAGRGMGKGVLSGAARRRRARAWRRRILLATAALAALVALALPWGGAGGAPLTPGPARAGVTVAPHSVYVVQPGDTLWSIAQRLDPTGDPRVIVAELEARLGSDTLHVGQHLRLP